MAISGLKIFSGADGFDPDNSQDIAIDSVFVHSNDDAVAVKATMPAPAMSTEKIVVTNAVFSTKKSCLKVGTESLRNVSNILFR